MYLVGQPHPNKVHASERLKQLIAAEARLVTDAEVFQEITHRYAAIRRRDAIQPAFDALLGVVDEVLAIELADVQRAKGLVLAYEGLSSRDALHAAVMRRRNIKQILSFDTGFDSLSDVERLS